MRHRRSDGCDVIIRVSVELGNAGKRLRFHEHSLEIEGNVSTWEVNGEYYFVENEIECHSLETPGKVILVGSDGEGNFVETESDGHFVKIANSTSTFAISSNNNQYHRLQQQ